jgi:hypothetical protein
MIRLIYSDRWITLFHEKVEDTQRHTKLALDSNGPHYEKREKHH